VGGKLKKLKDIHKFSLSKSKLIKYFDRIGGKTKSKEIKQEKFAIKIEVNLNKINAKIEARTEIIKMDQEKRDVERK
jgi:hypothetical protein